MNSNRTLGIFISVTILIWVLIFALSPQPKYQQITNINIPELPDPSVDQDTLQSIEFKEVKNDGFKISVLNILELLISSVAQLKFAVISELFSTLGFEINFPY